MRWWKWNRKQKLIITIIIITSFENRIEDKMKHTKIETKRKKKKTGGRRFKIKIENHCRTTHIFTNLSQWFELIFSEKRSDLEIDLISSMFYGKFNQKTIFDPARLPRTHTSNRIFHKSNWLWMENANDTHE